MVYIIFLNLQRVKESVRDLSINSEHELTVLQDDVVVFQNLKQETEFVV